MLTLFPALLLILPPRFFHTPSQPAAAAGAGGAGFLDALGRLCARAPRRVLLLSLVALAFSLPFARQVQFSDRLFALEPGDMPPALAQAEIARRFGEQQRFLVVLIKDGDKDGALFRADAWQAEAERLRQAGLLRGYEGISTLVPSQRTQEARRARLQKIVAATGAGTALGQALDAAGFDTAPFARFLQQLQGAPASLSPILLEDFARTELGFLARSHVADPPSGRLVALYLFAPADEKIKDTLQALLAFASGPAGGALTGLPLLEDELRKLLQADLLRVTAASLLAVVVLLAVYYRRLRPFLAVFLPLSVAWVMFAASLAVLRVPLNLYNLLAIPLCIGYGIDDHIFLVHRHEATPPALRDPAVVLRTTGRAIVLTTLATVAGFAGLIPAHFVGLRMLGLSGALAVLLCLCAAFLVLPALLALFWPQAEAKKNG
jgi:predicted RND superfamily exporter protein